MHLEYCDESLNRISTWDQFPDSLIRSIHELNAESDNDIKLPLLNGVGLYQDTFFNTRQLKMILTELELFKKITENKEAQSVADSLIEYINTVDLDDVENMGIYLRFVGD